MGNWRRTGADQGLWEKGRDWRNQRVTTIMEISAFRARLKVTQIIIVCCFCTLLLKVLTGYSAFLVFPKIYHWSSLDLTWFTLICCQSNKLNARTRPNNCTLSERQVTHCRCKESCEANEWFIKREHKKKMLERELKKKVNLHGFLLKIGSTRSLAQW